MTSWKKLGAILENKVHQKMKTLETVNYFLKNYFLKLFISYDFRCAPAWESSKYIIYTWYWLIMGFLLPLVIIIYANFKTVQCLKKVGVITIRLFFLHSDMFFILSYCSSKTFFLLFILPGQFYKVLHTVSFDWFLSGLEWILNLEFCLLKLLIFYQKSLWNIRSRLNSSKFWVFESVFKKFWSKSSFFVHKASILIKHI